MMRLAPILLALLLTAQTAMAQTVVGGSGPGWSINVVAAPSGPGLTILHQMDFEDSPTQTDCQDGKSTDTCSVAGSTPQVACTASESSTCPISGTQSGRVSASSEAIYKDLGGFDYISGFKTLDFQFNVETLTTAGTNVMFFITGLDAGISCKVYAPTTTTIVADALTGPDSSPITVATGVDYYGRLTYDLVLDDCTLRVGTSDYGATETGGPVTSDGSGSPTVDGWQGSTNGSSKQWVFDDIMMCDGDAGSTLGICGS